MADLCFVFASSAEKDAEGLLVKYLNKENNKNKEKFNHEFDIKYLC